jgi:hypothetical protein
MKDELFEQIKHFVIKFSCIRNVDIDRNTSLEKGIGLTGDDATEFILAFAKKFNVDVSNFMSADYFDAEGDKILPTISRLLINKKEPLKKQLILGDLEQAVIAGKLDDTIIESTKVPN